MDCPRRAGVSELNPVLSEELTRLRRENQQLAAKVSANHCGYVAFPVFRSFRYWKIMGRNFYELMARVLLALVPARDVSRGGSIVTLLLARSSSLFVHRQRQGMDLLHNPMA